MSIINHRGKDVITMYPDKGGDGFIRINSETGDKRYLLSLKNNKPQMHFFNKNDKPGLSLGFYDSNNISFIRLRDIKGDKTQINMDSNNKGGVLSSYSSNGKRIVFLGPTSNNGNGLVKVHGINGEMSASHSPK